MTSLIYSKNVWLKRETENELAIARVTFLKKYPNKKPTDDSVINAALRGYNNGN